MNVKMIRRITSGILLMVTLATVLLNSQTTYAATAKTSKELEKKLEKQYGITINISSKLLKDEEEAFRNLKLLEDSLNMMPKDLIKVLVKHYKTKGQATTIALSVAPTSEYTIAPGSYNVDTNTINLFVPTGSYMLGGGVDNYIIVHEIGHMVQCALYNIYGAKKLKSEFTAFNGKIEYKSEWNSEYYSIFVIDYAVTKFDEDFAETFAASIVRPQIFHELYQQDDNAKLIKKSEYMKKIIESQLKVKISQDEWRIYPQTPSKRYDGKLTSELVKGPNFENTNTYQYKITKEMFYQELREAIGDLDKDIKSKIEFDVFFEKYETNMTGKIKRKDIALIMDDVIKRLTVTDKVKVEQIFSDCDDLSSKYKYAIQNVVNMGLMNQSGGKFYPEAYCTYEQAYYAIIKLYEAVSL